MRKAVYVYLDESGDLGFKQGSTKYFTIAFVVNELFWFKPKVIIADAGYHAYHIYDDIVSEFDAEPIIDLARSKEYLLSGSPQAPYCPEHFLLVYMAFDKRKGLMRYKCPARLGRVKCPFLGKCPLNVAYVHPGHDYRRFGYRIPRTSPQWRELNNRKTAIERVFSRLKDERRLNSHCFRGFKKINLHCTLSILVMQAMALAKVQAGQLDEIRISARKVA